MRREEIAPIFGLYGESSQHLEPGFVHIEDVAARSRALDWRIKSHRHANLFQVLCIFDGSSEVQFNQSSRSLESGSVITIPLGVVHAFRFEPGTEGVVLTIADEVLRSDDEHAQRHFELLKTSARLIQFEPDSAQFHQLRRHLSAIIEEFDHPETGHDLMLTSLVNIVLTALIRRVEETRLHVTSSKSDSEILRGFRMLLERNYADQWSVARYASTLHTSVSSLNRRCKRYVGLTAKTIIQNRVLLEAKRKLRYTREPVEHVAFSLGFNDPAYFSRFFKKWEGVPPGEYRQSAAKLH